MHGKFLFPVRLDLFDGAAAAAPSAGADAGKGGTNGEPVTTQQATGEKVLYGKQTSGAEKGSATSDPKGKGFDAGSEEERSTKYKAFLEEYRDLYDADIQRIIGKRFRDVKEKDDQIAAAQPILDQLSQKYGTPPGDIRSLQAALDSDDAMWEEQAEQQGLTVEQYRHVQQLQRENEELRNSFESAQAKQRENQQIQTWLSQADQMRQDPKFKDFDLATEIQENPEFLSLLKSGIPVAHAYSVLHLDAITGTIAQQTAQSTEKAVTANIRARGARPQEAGASSRSGVVVKDDPSKWSKADLAEVISRVQRGEQIKL